MNRKKLSLEIFRDSETPEVDLEQIILGVKSLTRIVGDFELIDSGRPLPVTQTHDEAINYDDIVWHWRPVDLTVIATEREIKHAEDERRTQGLAIVTESRLSSLGLRSSIVSTYQNRRTEEVTEHEIGHMLNLKHFGETYSGKGHCTDENCKMYEEGITEIVYSTPKTLNEKLMNVMGLYKPTASFVMKQREFCDECTRQLEANTFHLRNAKSKIFTPENLILPEKYKNYSS